jgi:hypothetical protein
MTATTRINTSYTAAARYHKKTPAMRREGREEKAGVLGKSNYSRPTAAVKKIMSIKEKSY